jgi:hypothetical protein
MKFLNVYCESRKAEVFISLDKIILITKDSEDGTSLIELEGDKTEAVKVAMDTEELIRKINGEDRPGVGFRRSL